MANADDIRRLLAAKIRPELNHLYTVPPSETPSGGDFGWFCREHALHSYFVLRALGMTATVVSGGIWAAVLDAQGVLILATDGTDGDHFWVSTPMARPIDLSFSTRYFGAAPCPLVFGEGDLDDNYRVRIGSVANRDPAIEKPGTIYYQPDTEHSLTPAELIEDPYRLLNPRIPGGWADEFGDDVYHRVTWHLVKVARSEIRPLYPYRSQPDAIRAIVKRNSDAIDALGRMPEPT